LGDRREHHFRLVPQLLVRELERIAAPLHCCQHQRLVAAERRGQPPQLHGVLFDELEAACSFSRQLFFVALLALGGFQQFGVHVLLVELRVDGVVRRALVACSVALRGCAHSQCL
jgi:hypothetical protein